MTLTFILIGILAVSAFTAAETTKDKLRNWAFATFIFSAFYLLLHIGFWFSSEYVYEQFQNEGIVIENAMENAIKNSDTEAFVMFKTKAHEWNKDLLQRQNISKLWLLKNYYDERFHTLKKINYEQN